MKFLLKLRLDDRRKLLPLVPQPYLGHKHPAELSGGSEFLLMGLASSYLLVDTPKTESFSQKQTARFSKPLPKLSQAESENYYSKRQSAPYPQPGQTYGNYGNLGGIGNLNNQGSMPVSTNFNQGQKFLSVSAPNGHYTTNQVIHSPKRKPPSQGYENQPGQNFQNQNTPTRQNRQNQIQNHSQNNVGRPLSYQGPLAPPAPQYTRDVSQSTVDSNSSTEFSESDEYESESDLENQKKHPYYKQWKQYYAAMASMKNGNPPNQKVPQSQNANQSGNQNVNQRDNGVHRNQLGNSQIINQPSLPLNSAVKNSSEINLNYAKYTGNENNLIKNSRKSTIKLNRSSSVPSLQLRLESKRNVRAVSVNVALPEELPRSNLNIDISGAKPSRLGSTIYKLRVHGLLQLAQAADEISDYEAFLFEDTNDTTDASEMKLESANETVVPITESEIKQQMAAAEIKEIQNPPGGLELQTPESESQESENFAAPPQTSNENAYLSEIIQHGAPDVDLNRQVSSASTNSYNSVQSESNFAVGRNPHRLVTPSSTSSRKKKTASFVPPMPGPPPPILSVPPLPQHEIYSHHILDLNVSSIPELIQFHQMQQQIQQLQMQQRQMHGNYGNGNLGNGNLGNGNFGNTGSYGVQGNNFGHFGGPYANGAVPNAAGHNTGSAYGSNYGSNYGAPAQNWSTDSTINGRIQEFIELRKVIASGNKLIHYRLQWMKMLIVAVQYKLYAYVNIKGDTIGQDQIGANKQLFVKSSVTHLQKLLKELDGPKLPASYDVLAETSYIYGCLLKHEYVEKFDQDFGIEQNNEEAEHYLLESLQLNPAFFKAHYSLADIYEKRGTEQDFDRALEHYKESARLGYYRGIYRVALIFLMVPKVRSTNFFKYFRNLSEIDMQSADIQLSGTDRDELEEVVGLALYQLGRIYEGIYPGDLTAESEFVQASLELAPVNYAKALSYYNRGAKHHCLLAQVKLGHVYENGDLNRQKNASKSIQWFIKASTSPLKFKRHPEAMLGISRWFTTGSNGESKHIPTADPGRAVEWCDRACKEFQFAEAYFNMGLFAQQGLAGGNPEDWFAEAAKLGYVAANKTEVGNFVGGAEGVNMEPVGGVISPQVTTMTNGSSGVWSPH